MAVFPHMRDTDFPHLNNVDVYKYQNDFNYNRYDNLQMRITLCSVPWDMGEAHVGNRTISGIGNVVYFETEAKRDKWFADIPDTECYRFETKYKELHRDNMIAVPVPFDVASTFNYVMVEYEPFAAQGDPVQYERPGGIDKWFWFVREVEFVAPNTTILHLLNDAFQTFIYRMHFAGMVLERGHAPLFATKADAYLENPRANNAGLLAEDVNFGVEPSIVTHHTAHVFNDDTYCCIATTASPTMGWGTKSAADWHTPARTSYTVNGVPGYSIFALDVANLATFLSAIDDDYPQFKQTVKGVFFAPKELITLGDAFTFAGTNCHWVSTSNKTIDFVSLEKSMFGYPAKYADLAKLYTWPYAALVVADEDGNETFVKVEDTNGTLDISSSLSLAFPAITLQAHVLGVGGGSYSLGFSNITNRSLRLGGRWYETLHSWDVPIFGVVQSNSIFNDYDTFYDRQQQVTAYTNAYDSAVASANTQQSNENASAAAAQGNENASATTARDNAQASAATAKNNADANATNTTANAALQVAANTAMTAAGNTMASDDTQTGQTLNTNTTNNAITYTNASTNNEIELKNATAAASQASNAVNSAAGAIANGVSGNIPGAVTGVISGITQAAVINATNEAGVNYTAAQAAASNQNNRRNAIDTNVAAAETNNHAITASNSKRDASNTLTTGAAANTAATISANATRDKSTADANANRTYATQTGNATRSYNAATGNATRSNTTAKANAARNRDTAQKAIENGIKQAAIHAPQEFGLVANTANATTKPQALICNVATQSKNAVEMAGDEFLRYGYYYGKQWQFDGDWNIGKHFTYWKLKDFWVRGLNIPDMYVDKLRFFLFGGVTVWRRPEDIGNVTIYENM